MTEPLRLDCGPDELRKLNQAFPDRYPFLLQSTAIGGDLGRFDILFAFPGESIALDRIGQLSGRCAGADTSFLTCLDNWWHEDRTEPGTSKWPFNGGWFLYLGYELAAEIEPSLTLREDPDLPVAFAVRCPVAIILDHETNSCEFVSENSDQQQIERLNSDLANIHIAPPDKSRPRLQGILEDNAERFIAAVTRAKTHIEAGDIYQANLSRQWDVVVSEDSRSESIYASLCAANPGPFAGIARWQKTSIISSSPERLLQIKEGIISTRPIAGTRRRGETETADDNLSNELFAHPKERAEHVMLIDLERNDLGRVCVAGTVEVDEMMVLESYTHVHHIVSNVRGRIRKDVTPGQAIAAVFPGGTITGCPKVRCMEIIHELESSPRGAYTGSFGYLNRDGTMDLNILIRTMLKNGNNVSFRAGAGIVADSVPQAELDEARAKAEGMLKALSSE